MNIFILLNELCFIFMSQVLDLILQMNLLHDLEDFIWDCFSYLKAN
jgi:hypothetical protein